MGLTFWLSAVAIVFSQPVLAETSIQEIDSSLYFPQSVNQLPHSYFDRIQYFVKKIKGADLNAEPIAQTLSAVNDYLSQAVLWHELAPNIDLDWNQYLPAVLEIETSTRDYLALKHIKNAESLIKNIKSDVAVELFLRAMEITKNPNLREQIQSKIHGSASINDSQLELPILKTGDADPKNLPFKLSPFSTTESIHLYLALSYLQSENWNKAIDRLRILKNKPEGFFYNCYLNLLSRYPKVCEQDPSFCETPTEVKKIFNSEEFKMLVDNQQQLLAYQNYHEFLCKLSGCQTKQPLLFAHSQIMLNDRSFLNLVSYFLATVGMQEETGKWTNTEKIELLKIFNLLHKIYLQGARPSQGEKPLPITYWDQITYWHCLLLADLNRPEQAKEVLKQTIQSGSAPTMWLQRAKKL